MITVIPGSFLTITVGQGGSPGNDGLNVPGNPGGGGGLSMISLFGTNTALLSAQGGNGGIPGSYAGETFAGSQGGGFNPAAAISHAGSLGSGPSYPGGVALGGPGGAGYPAIGFQQTIGGGGIGSPNASTPGSSGAVVGQTGYVSLTW